jgi:hypothetical protein
MVRCRFQEVRQLSVCQSAEDLLEQEIKTDETGIFIYLFLNRIDHPIPRTLREIFNVQVESSAQYNTYFSCQPDMSGQLELTRTIVHFRSGRTIAMTTREIKKELLIPVGRNKNWNYGEGTGNRESLADR